MVAKREGPWWSTFFSGAALELWRQAIPPEVTAAEVASLCERLRLDAGTRVLDVPCGNGRIALGLAARGVAVTGYDISAEFVDEARAAAEAATLPATFALRDMRDLPAPGAEAGYDAVLCMGNSFGYLAGDENLEFLRRAVALLAPGGSLVVQTAATAETALFGFVDDDVHETAGMTLRAASTYEPLRGVKRVTYTFETKDGSRPTETKVAEYRIETVRRLCEVLRDAGLDGIEASSDLAGTPFRLGDPHVHLVGRKGGTPVL